MSDWNEFDPSDSSTWPPVGKTVLLAVRGGKADRYELSRLVHTKMAHSGYEWDVYEGYLRFERPSHWAELPAPPK